MYNSGETFRRRSDHSSHGNTKAYRIITAPKDGAVASLRTLSLPYSYTILQSGISILFPFLLLLVILLIHARPIHSETSGTVKLELSWGAVANAHGYIIEVQREDLRETQSHRTKLNRVSLDLMPGSYQIRLASLNKFSKPEAYTPWKAITITGKTKVQKVEQLEKAEDAPPPPDDSPSVFQPKALVPGLPGILKGEVRGYIWASTAVLSTGVFVKEVQRGNTIAHDDWNDPTFLSMVSVGQPLAALFYWRQRREDQHARYDQSIQRQAALGVLMIGGYIYHYYDSFQRVKADYKKSKSSVAPTAMIQWQATPTLEPSGRWGVAVAIAVRF